MKASDIIAAIATRERQLNQLRRKGHSHPALQVSRNLAYRIAKDALGYADIAGGVLIENGQPVHNDLDLSAAFVVSTSDEDRDGDMVLCEGIQTANYARNPLWLFDHGEWKIPVGSSTDKSGQLSFKSFPDRATAVCYFDQHDPDAVFLYGKVARGIIRGASIGFLPLIAEPRQKSTPRSKKEATAYTFHKVDLLEISIAPVPANAGALRLSMTAKEKSLISPRLLDGIAKCAGKRCCVTCGWTAPKRKTATGMGEAALDIGGALVPPKTAGNVRSILCAKTRFASKEKAEQWLKENKYEANGFKEAKHSWVFQSATEPCKTTKTENVADGVTIIRCEDAPMQKTKGCKCHQQEKKMPSKKKSGVIVKQEEEMPAADLPPEEVVDEVPGDEEMMPQGARILIDMLEHYEAIKSYLADEMQVLEQPDVKAALEEHLATIEAETGAMLTLAQSAYPDIDFGTTEDGMEEVEASEELEEEKEEETEEEAKGEEEEEEKGEAETEEEAKAEEQEHEEEEKAEEEVEKAICPSCGEEVPDDATECPHCKMPIEKAEGPDPDHDQQQQKKHRLAIRKGLLAYLHKRGGKRRVIKRTVTTHGKGFTKKHKSCIKDAAEHMEEVADNLDSLAADDKKRTAKTYKAGLMHHAKALHEMTEGKAEEEEKPAVEKKAKPVTKATNGHADPDDVAWAEVLENARKVESKISGIRMNVFGKVS